MTNPRIQVNPLSLHLLHNHPHSSRRPRFRRNIDKNQSRVELRIGLLVALGEQVASYAPHILMSAIIRRHFQLLIKPLGGHLFIPSKALEPASLAIFFAAASLALFLSCAIPIVQLLARGRLWGGVPGISRWCSERGGCI